MHKSRSILATAIAAIAISTATSAMAATVTVNRANKAQVIDGFGAHGSMTPWWNAGPFYDTAFLNRVIDDLGLTIIRNEYYPPEDGPIFDTKQKTYLQALRDKANASGEPLKMIATFWTPPGSFKSNGSTTGGGTLLYDHRDDLGNYAVGAAQAYANAGLTMYGLSLQNEPNFVESYNSCVYTREEYRDMIKVAGPIIHSSFPNLKLFGPEHMLWPYQYDNCCFYEELLIPDSAANAQMGFWACHGYGNDGITPDPGSGSATQWNWAKSRLWNTGKPFWMTETSGYSDSWADSLALGQSIYAALNYGNVAGWVWWQLSEPGNTSYALMDTGNPTKRYYVSKQYYRYVRPGSQRVDAASDDTGLYSVAFEHISKNTMTVVLTNPGATSKSVTLSGANQPATYTIYRTSATENCVNAGTVAGNGTFTVPASCIVTLFGSLSTPVPPVPTGLTATAGNTQVGLSWSASSGATAYDVKRSTVSGSGYATITSPTGTSYTNTGLTNGTTYYYVVAAKNAGGSSANSSQVSATPQPAIPPVPTGLSATAGNTQVQLSWTASTGATAYDLKRSTVSGSGYATITSPTGTSYTNTGLTNGTTYYYVVAAKNAGGSSANSAQVSATPSAPVGGLVKINAGGPAASPFIADANFTGGTPFTNWTGAIDTTGLTSPAPQAVYQSERFGAMTYTMGGLTAGTSYKVRLHMCENYFTTTGSRTFNVAINGTTVLANFDIFAAAGAIHKGVIREFTVAANGSGQEVIVFTNVVNNGLVNGIEVVSASSPPAAPTGLSATAGATQVALAWTASSGATSYNVKRSTVSGSGYATVSSPTATSYTNTGLTNGTSYYYVVTAVSSGGESGNSSQVRAAPYAAGTGEANIAKAATAPTIDGNNTDAVWSSATSYSIANTIPTVTNAADLTGSFKAAWDATNLYVLIDVTDESTIANLADPAQGDSVEVYLDAANNKSTTYDANDWQYVFAWGGNVIKQYQNGTAGTNTAGISYAYVNVTGGYRVEMKIPFATIGGTAFSGAAVGIDTTMNDADGAVGRQGKKLWKSTTDNDWTNPSLFGVGRLL
jgi:O-glycosyl hydrolase/fibronectin type 3 domain-containing protein